MNYCMAGGVASASPPPVGGCTPHKWALGEEILLPPLISAEAISPIARQKLIPRHGWVPVVHRLFPQRAGPRPQSTLKRTASLISMRTTSSDLEKALQPL